MAIDTARSEPASVFGTKGSNRIFGGDGADTISGLGGDDELHGADGNDSIYGGSGYDRIFGDKGEDYLTGGRQDDTITGGSGDDDISTSSGNDLLSGGFGDDDFDFHLDGGQGDTIRGGPGSDSLSVNYYFQTAAVKESFASVAGQPATLTNGAQLFSIETLYVSGSNFNDHLTGGTSRDFLSDGRGNDTLIGGGGNDFLQGSEGDDILLGGTGNDSLDCTEGRDTLKGGRGDDDLSSRSTGTITLMGGNGRDSVLISGDFSAGSMADGGAGTQDRLDLVIEDTANMFFNGATPDKVGTIGNLTFTGFEMFTVYLGSGDDTIIGGTSSNSLFGKDGNDQLTGGDGIDYLSGGGGTNTMNGGAGNDTLYSSSAGDVLNGGKGSADEAHISRGESGETFTLIYRSGYAAATSDGTVIRGCETFQIGVGKASFIEIHNTGEDAIGGSDENDSVFAGGGIDVLYGEKGNDTLRGGYGDDTLTGGEGADTLMGGLGDDSLRDGTDLSADTLNGGAGNDNASIDDTGLATAFNFTVGSGAVTTGDGRTLISIESVSLDCSDGNNRVTGGSLYDYMSGGAGNDTLNGAGGSDTLIGNQGVDSLTGGTGDDTLDAGRADGSTDSLDGGDGDDRVVIFSDGDSATGGLGNDTVVLNYSANKGSYSFDLSDGTIHYGRSTFTGFEAIDYTGSKNADTVSGGSGSDTFRDTAGEDAYHGKDGDDVFMAENDQGAGGTADTFDGGGGFDTVIFKKQYQQRAEIDLAAPATNGGVAALDTFVSIERFELTGYGDVFKGDKQANTVNGYLGGDELNGRGGDDWLSGGENADWLTGGSGADRFFYRNIEQGGDVITDFERGTDRIVIWQPGFNQPGLAFNELELTSIVVRTGENPAAKGAGPQFLFDTDDHQLWYDNDGGREGEAVLIATLNGITELTAADFILEKDNPGIVL